MPVASQPFTRNSRMGLSARCRKQQQLSDDYPHLQIFFLSEHCLNRWSRGGGRDGGDKLEAHGDRDRGDEPPAAHLCSKQEAPAVNTAGKRCAAVEACGIHTADDLCAADKPPKFGPARELCAADGILGLDTVPEFSAANYQQVGKEG
uniref:Uncharacterized protein n=1 Tax=Aegilops tauschii TaxID=37682 RepID=M8BXN1_AEGTA